MTRQRQILIVDDTPENLQVLGSMLEQEGYEVRVATDGPGALQSVREYRPDLILLDILMPGMDGVEVCRQLKKDPVLDRIPVIFISALGQTEDKLSAFREGGVDYIPKPFQAEEVVARVKAHIQLTRLEDLQREIEERKRDQETIAAEREQLAVTLHSIADGVITTDIQGNIVMMNRIAEKLTGWDQVEAQGKPVTEVFNIINQETRRPGESIVHQVLAKGCSMDLESDSLLVTRGGGELNVADSAAPLRDLYNNIVGVVLVFRDVTEKQKLTETLQRSAKLDALGLLAGGIAHDFNNLLGGIFGFIEMAKDDSQDALITGYLIKAMSTIERARSLTRQLMTFAKESKPHKLNGYLFPFLQETARFALSGSNVSCRFNVPSNLWACSFDKNQIAQVIDNIIINAQQAMPNGGVITVSAQNISSGEILNLPLSVGNYLKISINDSGPGIPRESLPRIFDPFFTTKAKGHGLGLTTSYSIIKNHGGLLDVESVLGKGSTFYIYLPAASTVVNETECSVITGHSGRGSILILDDEEVIRQTLCLMLTSLGYDVVCKDNGRDAIACFLLDKQEERRIVGMVFDLTMPGGMGGKDVIKKIREIDSSIPVFVASGHTHDPVVTSPANYGFTASITKPFTKNDLISILDKYMKLDP